MATVTVRRPDELGPALREARLADDVTQSSLAVLAGVGRQWLNSFELGDKQSAPLDMVMRVAAALGVTVTLLPEVAVPHPGGPEPIDLDAFLRTFDR